MARVQDSLDEGTDELPRWGRTVPVVLGLLLALALGLLVYLANHAADQRDRAISLQRHSFEVMLLVNQLDGTISGAEALLARYVVSLDANVGRQYQEKWRTTYSQVAALERSTRNSPAQAANVAELKAVIEERGKTLDDIALRTTYKQRMGALGRFYAAGKADTVVRMRSAIKRTIDYEKNALARLTALVDRSETRVSRINDTYAFIGLGLLTAALLALWFAYSAARERRFARRLASSEAARVDGLEIAVRERTDQLQTANAQLRREAEERAKAERTLRQLQKMEAIGKLTGGIAHDFNNMLAVVVSGIDLARETLVRDMARTQRHLDSAMEGATRAATLTDRLLAYARSEPLKSARVDVDGLVLGMRDLVHRATDDGIAVVLELNAGGWCIRAEEAQLENALLNLAINARDAMEGRGTLAVATRQITLAQDEIGQSAAGDYVCLSISDTGSGMPPEVIERIFEPFFTTKPVGKGTGLGLSQIFGFVRQSGGEIDVQSAVGFGTTFQIYLPRDTRENSEAEASTGSTPPQASAPTAALSAMNDARFNPPPVLEELDEADTSPDGQLILVVEDDPRVLRSTLAALQALGYRGISCDHPRKAGDLLVANPGVSLILSDVLMPDMTGPEMIMALGDIANQRPIVFVTGFAGEGERAAQVAEFPTLRKPFTLVQLGAAVADALNAHKHGKPAAPVH